MPVEPSRAPISASTAPIAVCISGTKFSNLTLTALILFAIIKAFNKAKDLKKKEEAPAAPTTKKCPFCMSEIDIKAIRCPHCTSELKE